MSPYRVLIFDFDGTLCATEEAILHTFRRTFEQEGTTPPSDEKVKEGISTGGNLNTMLPFLHPALSDDSSGQLLQEWVLKYRQLYHTEGGALTTLFDGAEALFEQIQQQGLSCVVISNKGQQAIEQALEHFNLNKYFDLVIGDNPNLPMAKKPDPVAFQQVILPRYPQFSLNQFLMIGDTHADLQFANNAGIPSCWAVFGYGAIDLCLAAAPTHTIHSLSELSQLLNSA
ncbi:HAD family hydrolase [Rufibacter roseus]|uniref:phosphoglycolate phosphatase n=1 Tax=Rufibacter roseus TaxID=1567108 RepID=A0ABW2DMJ1_9BACT|nr:HAD family hydrolase [Rufibacter roseus]